jgi:hypothetical protein
VRERLHPGPGANRLFDELTSALHTC